MSDYDFGVRDFEVADCQLFHSCPVHCFGQAARSARSNTNKSGDASSRSDCYLLVDECGRLASIYDESGAVSVERAFDIEVMVRI